MKIALPLFMILALGMCVFNLIQIDWNNPLGEKKQCGCHWSTGLSQFFSVTFTFNAFKKNCTEAEKIS